MAAAEESFAYMTLSDFFVQAEATKNGGLGQDGLPVLFHDGNTWPSQACETAPTSCEYQPRSRQCSAALVGWTSADKPSMIDNVDARNRSGSGPLNTSGFKRVSWGNSALDGNVGSSTSASIDALDAVAASWERADNSHTLGHSANKCGATVGILASGRVVRRASRVQIVSDLDDPHIRPRHSSMDDIGLQRHHSSTSHSGLVAARSNSQHHKSQDERRFSICSNRPEAQAEHSSDSYSQLTRHASENLVLPDINPRSGSKPRPKPKAPSSWSDLQTGVVTEVLVGVSGPSSRRGSQIFIQQDSFMGEPSCSPSKRGKLPRRSATCDQQALWKKMQPSPPLSPLAPVPRPLQHHRRCSSARYHGGVSLDTAFATPSAQPNMLEEQHLEHMMATLGQVY